LLKKKIRFASHLGFIKKVGIFTKQLFQKAGINFGEFFHRHEWYGKISVLFWSGVQYPSVGTDRG